MIINFRRYRSPTVGLWSSDLDGGTHTACSPNLCECHCGCATESTMCDYRCKWCSRELPHFPVTIRGRLFSWKGGGLRNENYIYNKETRNVFPWQVATRQVATRQVAKRQIAKVTLRCKDKRIYKPSECVRSKALLNY